VLKTIGIFASGGQSDMNFENLSREEFSKPKGKNQQRWICAPKRQHLRLLFSCLSCYQKYLNASNSSLSHEISQFIES